jgi:hypothetical protein
MLGELGRRGMRLIYKARHLKLNRVVALKPCDPHDHCDDLLKW